MILRVWILGILLVVLLWIYLSNTEGFQSGTRGSDSGSYISYLTGYNTYYTLPPSLGMNETRTLFWSILNQQKIWKKSGSGGSGGSGGSRIGIGSSMSTQERLYAVINPAPNDIFRVTFANYISIYALAKYNMDPVAARFSLMNNYDAIQAELVANAQTGSELAKNAIFTSDITSHTNTTACTELNAAAMSIYGQAIALERIVADLSGTGIIAEKLHDENSALQGSSACINQGATPSASCIKLASQDETLFPILHDYDEMNISLLVNGQSLQNILNTILQAYNGMKCSMPTGQTPNISSVFSETYIQDLGTIDTEGLSMKLQELSPYYVSPTLITYITRQLMATSQFNTNMQSATDYILRMSKTTNAIVSLTMDLEPGAFYDESGSAGIRTCPPGYYCPGTVSSPIPCPVGKYCPTGTTGSPLDCPLNHYSPMNSSDPSQCTTSVPLGYYSKGGVATLCPAGTYCPPGRNPISCPAGTYNALQGKSELESCIECPAGSYCASTVSSTGPITSPTPCEMGTYSSTKKATSKSTCRTCPAGTTCPRKGMPSPSPCPAGTYSSVLGHTKACTQIIAGFYSSTIGSTSSSSALNCPIGSYCPRGSGSPVTCPAGSYCNITNLQVPIPCPAGSYGSTLGLQTMACSGSCTAGYYCPPGSKSPTEAKCPAGSYCPAGITLPIPCTPGNYCMFGSVSPTQCPPGTYNPNRGGRSTTDCQPCTPGYYCPIGTATPILCTAGNYCNIGSILPIVCPSGKTSPIGATSIAACI